MEENGDLSRIRRLNDGASAQACDPRGVELSRSGRNQLLSPFQSSGLTGVRDDEESLLSSNRLFSSVRILANIFLSRYNQKYLSNCNL